MRVVTCLNNGEPVELSRCDSIPERERPCQGEECQLWMTSDWTDCSTTCGVGIRYVVIISNSSLERMSAAHV